MQRRAPELLRRKEHQHYFNMILFYIGILSYPVAFLLFAIAAIV